MLVPKDLQLLNEVAIRLGVAYNDLFNLINFESGFNPLADNPNSSARGLIQFMDSTAKSLGFTDSLDLVKKNPTIEMQLPIVEKYLKQYYPFKDKQSLYMSVFYPEYRDMDPQTEFPDYVKKANPGINTPYDYMNFIERKKKLNF